MLTFNHATQRILVPQADAMPLLMQALIDAIREEEASERGIVEPQIADAVGKDALGGGVTTGITVNLRGTWKLDFSAGAYQATVSGGNLADALARIANTGSPQVLVQSSAAATITTGDGGGSAPSAGAVAAAVWDAPVGALLQALATIHGLVPGQPLEVTPTSRRAGTVEQTITEAGSTVTVSRSA